MNNIYNYTLDKLADLFEELGQKRFRATQIFTWLYKKRVSDFASMSDVSKYFIDTLNTMFTMQLPTIHTQQISKDGTIKVLFKLEDGNYVEAVIMKYNYGNVLCISTQIGCNMGCSFCASGLLKKSRNLETHEMVTQLIVLEKTFSLKISNIVVMGTGEPFDNYTNTMNFLTIVNCNSAFEIGARHLTVSTCGLVPKIIEFADFPLQVNLAISLHASNDKLRSSLMPISQAYSIKEIMKALRYYVNQTKRRVTFEYLLLKDINDSDQHAQELVDLVRGNLIYVNLIPYNEVPEMPYKRSKRIDQFAEYLKNQNVDVTVRKEFGKDISAACGQLRAKTK
jgi:23S rRNA (adenine2503-C2)-methyltransferase